jgi:hypothetical protein
MKAGIRGYILADSMADERMNDDFDPVATNNEAVLLDYGYRKAVLNNAQTPQT